MSVIINGLDEHMRELEVIDNHLHNREIWFGNGAVEDSQVVYTIISGNGAYGSAVELLGASDTPVIAGMLKFDLHRVFIRSYSNNNPFYMRLIWGQGTVGDAETAKQYTTFPLQVPSAGNRQGQAVPTLMKRRLAGLDTVWAKLKSGTNLASVELLFGVHEYPW